MRECRAAAGAVLITKAAPALRFAAELAAALLIVAAWLLVFGAGQREVCVRVGVALVLGGNCP